MGQGFRQETHRLSEEILHREALPRENHSQLLLEQEKERTDFYAAQCGASGSTTTCWLAA